MFILPVQCRVAGPITRLAVTVVPLPDTGTSGAAAALRTVPA
jgi:hypothetical protein